MSDKPRVYYVKAQGHQYEMPVYCKLTTNDYIDLTVPGEDRWITTIIQTVPPYTNAVSIASKWLELVNNDAYLSVLKERDELKQKLDIATEALNQIVSAYKRGCVEYKKCECYWQIALGALEKIKPDGGRSE